MHANFSETLNDTAFQMKLYWILKLHLCLYSFNMTPNIPFLKLELGLIELLCPQII